MSPDEVAADLSADEIAREVQRLGPWFHNLNLNGIQTAPDHFLGDYPAIKWKRIEHALPSDLTGKSVLDIGCNAGFFMLEMKRRGAARIVGIDVDEDYLNQARFALRVNHVEAELHRLSVYQVGQLRERFDFVIFTGVLYHLRHPLLALDLLSAYVVKDLLLFQSLLRGSYKVAALEDDYPFWEKDIFKEAGYPRLHFVEHCFAHDPTNWWIPNRACAEAMLRASGFAIEAHPEQEVWLCRRSPDHPPPELPF